MECKGVQYFEYRKYSNYFGFLHCCCCGYCLYNVVGALYTATDLPAHPYEYVQAHCLSYETKVSVLA